MNDRDIKIWYVYMLRCEDLSIYTGITVDMEKRYKNHQEGKGAKYTRSKKPIEICAVFKTKNRSSATKLECFIKKNSKKNKEFIVFSDENKKNFIIKAKKELNIEIFL